MSIHDFMLPVYYLRQIADQLGGMGVDVPGLLGRNQLSEAQLNDPSLNVSYPVFRQLLLDGMALTQEPALGLLVGKRLLVNTHGILSHAAMNSGSLRQAVELFERYILLRTSMVSVHHETHGRELHLVLDEAYPLGDIRRPVLEAVLLTVKNVLDYITMGAHQVSRVAFAFAQPDYAGLAQDLFGCEVAYGQTWSGLALPLGVMDAPLKMADPATFEEATRICQRELEKLTLKASLAAKVRRLMLEGQNGFPSLQVTARLFNLTPRTLHRRLLDEGTSFKDILEDVRHTLAVEHLKSGHLSLQEIAYRLGYTDMANFRRAFKRWEAIPPSEYRSRHLGG